MRFLLLALLLTACSVSANPELVYQRQGMPYPALESFPHCRSYGCAKLDMVNLSQSEQTKIKNIFGINNSAAREKQNIRQAVATFEQIVGAKTGTSADVAGTYVTLGHNQHDCVDESTNTTTYLILLDKMGLVNFHDVNALTSRPPILSGRLGPHRTAVITDKQTGIKYAVDSWFHDNGIRPEIIELDKWKRGWHPSKL